MDSFYDRALLHKDTRKWLYNFLLESCGFDVSIGVTIVKGLDNFDLGKMSVAMGIYNEMVGDYPNLIKIIKKEAENGEYTRN